MRGATGNRIPAAWAAPHISIHAPRAGRDRRLRLYRADPEISIHAPRAGRDAYSRGAVLLTNQFQSTRPVRGATPESHSGVLPLHISIHAPRAGRDQGVHQRQRQHRDFNPRAPCGARPAAGIIDSPDRWKFQSTRPVRGATPCKVRCSAFRPFQSTRPVRGATGAVR